MILDKKESVLFFKIYLPLLVSTGKVKETKYSNPTTFIAARKYLFDNPEIFAKFIKKNSSHFSKYELSIISNWQNKFVRGNFIFFRQLKKHAIFISTKDSTEKAYQILGLTDSPKDLVGIDGVFLQDVVLLSFEKKIIWDGLFFMGPILGKNYLWDYNELYKELKVNHKIINEL